MPRRRFERHSLTLFHVRGVPIRAHWTLLLILPYLAAVLAIESGRIAGPAGIDGSALVLPPLLWGLLIALGLFASVAIHELAHAVLTVRFGGQVRSITLMLLGGVTEATRMPRRALHEGLMALAGPLTSLALGLVLALIQSAVTASADVELGLFYLSLMNIVLAVFNLLPAFPMDGGRVLRAALTPRLGAERATRVATVLGRVLAVGMGLLGVFTGNFLLLLVALFVYAGAGAEDTTERVRAALDGVRVRDLVPSLAQRPVAVGADTTLADALATMHAVGQLELVVTDRGVHDPLAVVEATDLARAAHRHGPGARLRDALPALPDRHLLVAPGTPANEAIAAANERGVPYLVVIGPHRDADDGLIGLVTPHDIERAVTLRIIERADFPSRRGPTSFAPTRRGTAFG